MLLVFGANGSLCAGFYDLIMSNETYRLDMYDQCLIVFEKTKFLLVIYEILFTVERNEGSDYCLCFTVDMFVSVWNAIFLRRNTNENQS